MTGVQTCALPILRCRAGDDLHASEGTMWLGHRERTPGSFCRLIARQARCFCCFGRKFTAGGIPFSAEILGYRRFGQRENSDLLRCFPLFLLSPPLGNMAMVVNLSQASIFVNSTMFCEQAGERFKSPSSRHRHCSRRRRRSSPDPSRARRPFRRSPPGCPFGGTAPARGSPRRADASSPRSSVS